MMAMYHYFMSMRNDNVTRVKTKRRLLHTKPAMMKTAFPLLIQYSRCSLLLLLLFLMMLESFVAASAATASSSAAWYEVESSSSSSSYCFWGTRPCSNRRGQGTTRNQHGSVLSCSSLSQDCRHVDMVMQQQQQQQRPTRTTPPTLSLESSTIAIMMQLRGGGGGDDDNDHQHHHPDKSGSASGSSCKEEQILRKNADFHGYTIVREEVIYNHWRKLIRRVVQFPPATATTTTTIKNHFENQEEDDQQQQQQQPPQQHQPERRRLVADFEVISQGDHGGTVSDEAVLIFVWNRANKTATLIQEYMPSNHQLVCGLAAGMVEKKHSYYLLPDNSDNDDNDSKNDADSIIISQQQEQQQRRVAAEHELEEECQLHGGEWFVLCEPTTLDKYTTTRLSAYLVIDPHPVIVHETESENNNIVLKQRDATEQGMTVIPGVSVSELIVMMTSGQMTVVGCWGTQLALRKLRLLHEIRNDEDLI